MPWTKLGHQYQSFWLYGSFLAISNCSWFGSFVVRECTSLLLWFYDSLQPSEWVFFQPSYKIMQHSWAMRNHYVRCYCKVDIQECSYMAPWSLPVSRMNLGLKSILSFIVFFFHLLTAWYIWPLKYQGLWEHTHCSVWEQGWCEEQAG